MPSQDVARLADVRALLAALHDAERLRRLPIVRELLGAVDSDSAAQPVAAAVRGKLEVAIESLDSRARTIVVRCDLAGETHRAVAGDLGIGERYFYRERRRALLDLAGRLRAPGTVPPEPITPEPLDALLGAAAAARNSGHSREAIASLAGAYASEQCPRLRATLALRLAQFAADSAKLADVAAWVERGRHHLTRIADSPAETAVARCEFDLVEMRADVVVDDYARAEGRARAVARRLRTVASHRHGERIATALGATYACLSDAQIMRGSFADGLALALEGQATLQRLAAFAPQADIDATVAVAQARIFATGSLARCGDDFGRAYSRAVSLGLGREIAKIAASLALVCALRGDTFGSVAFSRTARTVGRRLLTATERVSVGVDLAAAALARRDVACARAVVADAMPFARGLMANVLTFVDAEIHLQAGEPRSALALARRAADEIGRSGNERFLGAARRIEAEAFAAIGERSAAAHRIAGALDCLDKAAHPVALSRTLALSARVTGNRRHAASARELQASLKAV